MIESPDIVKYDSLHKACAIIGMFTCRDPDWITTSAE